mgnify:CR=1 FL=1
MEDDEHLIYVKDYQEDSDCGDLYINKNKIDYDVCISNSLYDKESGKVIYCADWDASGIGKSLPFAQKVNAAGKVLNLHQPKTKQQ